MNDLNIKLPSNDFFAEFAKDKSISLFGKSSRDEALKFVKKFTTVIDIGAHVGISVLHWASVFKSIHAFEPMIDHFNLLKDNTDHLKNIKLYNVAISNENGKIYGGYRTNKNTGSFQIFDKDYQQPSKKESRKLYEINVSKLDSFNFETVDLIKIDVEGWEYEVILGAQETIKKHRPILLVEFTEGNSKKSLHKYDVEKYYKLINDLGYTKVSKIEDDTIYVPREL